MTSSAPGLRRDTQDRIRRALATVAVTICALSTLLAAAVPALAESTGWQRDAGGWTPGGSYFGTFTAAGGERAICALDGAKFGPGHPDADGETASVYSDPQPVTSLRPQRYDGSFAPRISGRVVHELGYVMATFADTGEVREAVAADLATIRLAGAELAWQAHEADRIAAGASARADVMIAEAREHAGPYRAGELTLDLTEGELAGIGARDAGGDWVPGYQWRASLRGPATWEDGSRNAAGTTQAGPLAQPLTVTGNGEVSVELSVTGLPGALHRMDPLDGDASSQRLFPAGRTQRVTAAAAAQAVVPFQPGISTTVADEVLAVGAELIDEVTVTGQGWAAVGADEGREADGVPVTFEGTLYGPYAQPRAEQPSVPEGQPAAGTTSLTVTAPGTYPSEAFVATEPGFYTWVWQMRREAQDTEVQPYLLGDVITPFFERPETTTVRHPGGATSQVDAADRLILPGDSVRDTVTVAGFPHDHPEFAGLDGSWTADTPVVTHRLYGPFEQRPHEESHPVDLDTAPVAAQVDSPAVNGEVSVLFEGEAAPSAPGHYVIVSSFDGDARVAPWRTSPYDESEMLQVARAPTVTTRAQETAGPGEPFVDVASISDPDGVIGAEDGWDWSVEFAAYAAGDVEPLELDAGGEVVAERAEVAAVCEADPIAVSTAPIEGAGQVESEPVDLETPGHVFWVERLVRENEERREVVGEGICGVPNETTVVTAPPATPPQPEQPAEPQPVAAPATATVPELAETGSMLGPATGWRLTAAAALLIALGLTVLSWRERLQQPDRPPRH
ncbi:hypothetical protein LQF12_00410 [Ruania suaedae]|uniref:hypothetical protein n=1 Tax=Ruania suaedae TaxID=2897774 RepID=UPI001E293186|nr:hypothetical protein [Ruania suaedae]UFU03110.1 hypothetical protein LQF12_00410 [Ruania suaedae]